MHREDGDVDALLPSLEGGGETGKCQVIRRSAHRSDGHICAGNVAVRGRDRSREGTCILREHSDLGGRVAGA